MTRHLFKLPDGRQLSWYETGQGKPLVLLHGWAMSAAAFGELASLLAADFRLLIPDLPGHGNSDPSLPGTFPAIAQDLNAWLTGIEVDSFFLGGWSLGGMLALEMAQQRAEAVAKIILIATTPKFVSGNGWAFGLPAVQVRALARNLGRRFEATLADFFTLAFAGEDISRERLREIRNFAVKQSPLPDHGAALALLHQLIHQDQLELVQKIDQPTLVVHGDLDQVSPVAAGRYISEMLPHGQLAELPGVGHGPFLSCPLETAAMIREFC